LTNGDWIDSPIVIDGGLEEQMMRGCTVGMGLMVALAFARPSSAQSALVLTLDDAVSRGLADRARLAEARAREAAADAVLAGRAAQARPALTASAGVLRTNHVDEFGVPQAGGGLRVIFPDLPNNYRTRAELAVPIYTSGRVDALERAAEADRRAATADRRTAEADIALEVRRAYWTLVLARENVGVIERALARSDAAVAAVRARVDAGVLPPNDLLSAQAQRARQNVRLIQARHEAGIAEAQLARAIGADPGQSIVTSTPIATPTPGAAALAGRPAGDLAAEARGRRAERQGLVDREAALADAAVATLAAVRPQIAAIAAIEPARPNPRFVPRVDEWNTSWDLGVNVTWTIWDGGRARSDRAATLAQAEALRHRLADVDAAIGVEVRQRLLDRESAEAALAACGEAVAAATENQRVVQERFTAGVATSTDVLDAEVALSEAELECTRLAVGVRLAEAALVRAVGP
jgi:outer membrane protein TolC